MKYILKWWGWVSVLVCIKLLIIIEIGNRFCKIFLILEEWKGLKSCILWKKFVNNDVKKVS